jgi:imidazolonepropionase-like amidohydrolase
MGRVVVAGGRVFDGTGAPAAVADVALQDGRIVDVGRDLDGDERVEASGCTVLPGFFDCHVHLLVSHIDSWRYVQEPFSYQFFKAVRSMEATLVAGLTSVRDAGGADLGLKRAQQDGVIRGPRVQISVRMLTQTGGHGDDWYPSGLDVPFFTPHPGVPDTVVDGPDEMRKAVRTLIRHGAEVIKVATSGGVLSARDDPRHAHFRPEELQVLVEEAEAAGVPVMAHAQATQGIKNAIRAGIRSIEHGIYLDDEAIGLMLENGTYLVPTLLAPQGVVDAADAGAQIPEASLAKARSVIAIHRESFRRAAKAGVKVAMGTDSGVTPHGDNLRELALMEAAGMRPEDVLVATTRNAAELLGVADELGTIAPGKRADLVLVEGDVPPLDDLRARVRGVWQDGVRVA